MPPVLPTLPAIAAALQRAFPGLTTVAPLSILGEGFSSRVVETPRRCGLTNSPHARGWGALCP